MITGERIKWARKRAKLTQDQLAAKVGITKSSISGLELGTSKKPSSENLLPLADALGVDPNWLITGKGDPNPKQHHETAEPVATYTSKPKPFMPWPSKMEDLNMVFIEDVARRISEATGQPIAQIRNIIHEEIQAHYAPQIDPAYIDTCANIALAEIEEEQGFIFKGKDRDTMLTSLKKEIALTAIEDTKQPMGGDVDSTTRKISNGN